MMTASLITRLCKQCDQTTHMEDRDCCPDDPCFVQWHKTKPTPDGIMAYGCECYICFDVRRELVGLQVSAAKLKTDRENDRTLDDKFCVEHFKSQDDRNLQPIMSCLSSCDRLQLQVRSNSCRMYGSFIDPLVRS